MGWYTGVRLRARMTSRMAVMAPWSADSVCYLVAVRLEDPDRAAPAALAAIQGRVGLAEQLATIGRQQRDGGDAPGEGDDALARGRTQAEVAQAVGGDEGLVGVGVREDDRELVSADAEGPVSVAQRITDAVGHAHQETIAGRVTLAVVDDLEVVEVDEQQRHRYLVPPVQLQLAVQLLLEGAVVAEPGQAVVERVLARLPVQHLQLRLRSGEVIERLQEGARDHDRDEQHHDGEADEGQPAGPCRAPPPPAARRG